MNKITAKFWCPSCGYRPTISKINFLDQEITIDTECTMCKHTITYKTTLHDVDIHCPVCSEINVPHDLKLEKDTDNNDIVSGKIDCICGNSCTIIFSNLELPTNWLPERIIENKENK